MKQGHSAYPFVCPECGEEVRDNTRCFSLQPLMNHIVLSFDGTRTSIGSKLNDFIVLSARFGADVLGNPIKTVRCESAKPEREQLSKIVVSVESILQQLEEQMQLERGDLAKLVTFQREEGGNLWDKYEEYREVIRDGKRTTDEDLAFCMTYARAHDLILKNIHSRDLSNKQMREQELNEFLDILVELSNAEKQDHNGNSMLASKYQIAAAWCYTVDPTTSVEVPDMLYLELADEHGSEVCSSKDSCCPYCRKEISKHFGACPQKIIGVLGGQSTGKTTYMAAFADMLDRTNLDDLPFTISYEPEGDAQWRRFQASSKDGNFGAMWAYQNGYNAQKTDLQSESAVSLSFLVSPKEKGKIPTVYVLADIPGEVFNGAEGNKVSDTIQNSRKIFQYCQARLMTLSCDPHDAQIAAANFNEWLSQFPKVNIPAAFLLTKFDRSQNTPAVKLAYSLNQAEYKPYVPGANHTAVYNIERMSTLCRYAKQQSDRLSPNLFTILLNAMQAEQSDPSEIALTAFLINSGTAGYIDYTTADDVEQKKDRVSVARSERYGVLAPILWLLALDGYIKPGRREDELLTHSPAAEAQLQELWNKELHQPDGTD